MKRADKPIISDKAGYWDKRCEMLSSFLWLPAKKVLDNMPQSTANLESSDILNNSWFFSQIYSLPYSSHHSRENLFTQNITRTKKIRIYPNSKQREILNNWFKAARYVYNKTLEYINEGNKADWLNIKSKLINDLPEWTKVTPYQIKAVAVRDACINSMLSAKTKSTARFKARNDAKQSIFVPRTSATKRGIYTRFLGVMDYAEDMPEIKGDCRLLLDCGRWFVSVPVDVETEFLRTNDRAVSLDPGVRNFVTFYSLDSCGKIGNGAFSRIYSLCDYLDELNGKMKETNHKKRYSMKKAAQRLTWKIRNLLEEMNNKTALFLVRNFDVIVIPEIREDFADEFKSISMKEFLRKAHKDFLEHLRDKAKQYGSKVVIQDEEFTSQICSWNGEKKRAGKFIKDKEITLDRDYNGARGIFLRAMRESAILKPI